MCERVTPAFAKPLEWFHLRQILESSFRFWDKQKTCTVFGASLSAQLIMRSWYIFFAITLTVIVLVGTLKFYLDPLPKACVHYVSNQYEKALDEANQAVNQDPTGQLALHLRALVLVKLGQNQSALTDYCKLIELAPTYSNFNDRGDLYQQLGRHREAIADYNHTIDLEPGYDQPYIGRARALNASGLYKRAIDDYGKAMELERPNVYTDLYLERGQVFLNAKQWGNALADYTHELESGNGNDSPYPYEGLGIAYLHLGQPELAKDNLKEAIRLRIRNKDIYSKTSRQDLAGEENKHIEQLKGLLEPKS